MYFQLTLILSIVYLHSRDQTLTSESKVCVRASYLLGEPT